MDKQPWFVGERAMALASLLLTSRQDVAVRQLTGDDTGIDILAEVSKDAGKPGRCFGVQVVGRLELPDVPSADLGPRPMRRKQLLGFTMPLCAFLFDVRSNRGFFRWIIEPVLDEGEPRLARQPSNEWTRLDERVIGDIVDRVVDWYDALALRLRAS